MSKPVLALGVLVAVGATVAFMQLHRTQAGLRTENYSLRQQLTQLQTENESLSNLLVSAGSSKKSSGDQLIELLKLRNDVRALQQQAGEAGKLREQIQRLQTVARDTQSSQAQASAEALEQQQQAAVASLNHARQGVLAFIMFADENQERFPATFAEAAPFSKMAWRPSK